MVDEEHRFSFNKMGKKEYECEIIIKREKGEWLLNEMVNALIIELERVKKNRERIEKRLEIRERR